LRDILENINVRPNLMAKTSRPEVPVPMIQGVDRRALKYQLRELMEKENWSSYKDCMIRSLIGMYMIPIAT